MLLAAQAHERGIALTHIAGFRTWPKPGRSVRKGESALRILASVTIKHRDKPTGEQSDERRVLFKTAFVFDVSQTDPLPGAEAVALEAPHQPLSGDSHAHLLTPLCRFADSLGYSVSFEVIEGSAGGWCDPNAKRIVVDVGAPGQRPAAHLDPRVRAAGFAPGLPGDQTGEPVERAVIGAGQPPARGVCRGPPGACRPAGSTRASR